MGGATPPIAIDDEAPQWVPVGRFEARFLQQLALCATQRIFVGFEEAGGKRQRDLPSAGSIVPLGDHPLIRSDRDHNGIGRQPNCIEVVDLSSVGKPHLLAKDF